MDLLLVNPFHETHVHSFSWGVLSNASYLTREGFDVRILDGSYYLHDEASFRARLLAALEETDLVGFTCFSTDCHTVKSLCDLIKDTRPAVRTIVGGPHAILLPEQTARYRNIDFVAYGPGELTLERLIRTLRQGRGDFRDVPGLVYWEGSGLVRTEPSADFGFYDIDYELLPEVKKATYGRYMQVLTGRGCSYRCSFCYNAIVGQRWKPRPVEEIVAELKSLLATYEPRHIYFRDENFFQSKERIREFIRRYREEGFSFGWRATIRANYFNPSYITPALLAELESIHCEELKFGLESGSQEVLNHLNKGIRIERVREVIDAMARVRIVGNYSFLIGVPGETVEQYRQTLRLIRYIQKTDPDANVIGPQYYRVYPGGALYDEITASYPTFQPETFEGWAEAVRADNLGLNKAIDYPWLPEEGRDLAKVADALMLLCGKSVREMLHWKRLPALPFVLLAKARVRREYYRHLWDMKLFAWFFKKLHLYY